MSADDHESPQDVIARLRRRVARADRARQEAERLLESKSRSLWSANQRLQEFAAQLEQRVNERTAELMRARDAAVAAEKELAEAMGVANAANQAKTDFLANMSHEIRTPLAAILGYAELLESLELEDEDPRAWLRRLRLNAEHLLSLVGDVLDLSRIEAGELDLELGPVSLADELANVEAMIAPRAADKGLALEVEVAGQLPAMLQTDGLRLRQILLNLTANAVKFTQEGRVWLGAAMVGERGDQLQLLVGDTGEGIEAEALQSIFLPFRQIAPTSSNGRAGTGLGLDISRRLAKSLGATLEVESTVGVGSVFRLTFPAKATASQDIVAFRMESRPPSRPYQGGSTSCELGGVQVFIVDDSPDNRRILALMLERAGAVCTTFSTGFELIAELRAGGEAPVVPSVVLMDLQMPEISGEETARRLRDFGFAFPICALSADASALARQRSLRAGCDAYMAKPVVARELVARVAFLSNAPRRPLESVRADVEDDDFVLPQWVVDEFRAALGTHADELQSARESHDSRTVRLVCHRLAGSAQSYGFPLITQLARACEKGLDGAESPMRLDAKLDELIAQLRQAAVAA